MVAAVIWHIIAIVVAVIVAGAVLFGISALVLAGRADDDDGALW